MNRAWVEVDLNRLAQNVRDICVRLRPGVRLMAMVKADAYGHGAVEVARAALEAGASYLGVAWVTEAEQLRQAGITAPILVLSEPGSDDAIAGMLRAGVEVTAYTSEFISALAAEAQRLKQQVSVHVKVDTGMGRVGVSLAEAVTLCQQVVAEPSLKLKGVYTHFAMADQPEDPYTGQQIQHFDKVLQQLKLAGISPELVHASNSAGTRHFPQAHYGMVRVGLDLYANVLTFNTVVTQVKQVPAGQRLSYGGIYITPQATHIATLSAGYADGVDRLLSNRGRVLIHGQPYPIVGRVTMDMLLVDLGPRLDPEIRRGDLAVLIGRSGKEHISVDEMANECGTIPYEIMCGIGKRVPRMYTQTNT